MNGEVHLRQSWIKYRVPCVEIEFNARHSTSTHGIQLQWTAFNFNPRLNAVDKEWYSGLDDVLIIGHRRNSGSGRRSKSSRVLR